jgi:glycosyltransferase involved in cell wall biosynthesis
MKILIACTQYPYHGGAATNSYALIKALRRRGHTVCGIFFENSKVNCDPDSIGGIIKSSSSKFSANSLRSKIKRYFGGVPDIMLSKNYVAPIYCKKLFPRIKNIYLVSGSPLMRPLSAGNISAVRYLSAGPGKYKIATNKSTASAEKTALRQSDGVLLNSKISKLIFSKTHPNPPRCKISDPINTSIIVNKNCKINRKEFGKRDIDIAFICSNFSRTVKNANFAKKIFKQDRIRGRRKLVVGQGFARFEGIPNMTVKNKTVNENIIKYLGRTKLVICTSYFDASPNIINEAISSGCNILVSKNCGWSEEYSERSVCNDVYNTNEWINKISYLCDNNISYNNLCTKKEVLDKLEKFIRKVKRA